MKNPDFTAKNDGSTMKKTGLYNHENYGKVRVDPLVIEHSYGKIARL